jgi:polyhydroxyalkanoate synthesis repressor PhaR
MPVIKRYPNRKLYDTRNNKYVNLETIANMIRDGEEVQVVDNVTGEDLTAVTLTQIIMEREKKEGDFVPRSILAELIQAGGESLNTIRQRLGSPSDIIQQVDHEIAVRLEGLIERGEIAEEAGKKLRDQLIEGGQIWGSLLTISEKDIEDALLRQDLPTREEFQLLMEQIDAISEQLDDLESSGNRPQP